VGLETPLNGSGIGDYLPHPATREEIHRAGLVVNRGPAMGFAILCFPCDTPAAGQGQEPIPGGGLLGMIVDVLAANG